MNFLVDNEGEIFNDAEHESVTEGRYRHVRVVDVISYSAISCRPNQGPNKDDEYIFSGYELIKMDNKFSV